MGASVWPGKGGIGSTNHSQHNVAIEWFHIICPFKTFRQDKTRHAMQ